MSRVDAAFKQRFNDLTSKTYPDQAKWFMNGFWEDVKSNPEQIWKWVNTAAEIDRRKTGGNDLDEFEAHRFLETLGETLTVQAMRNKFREIDIDFNKRMAFIEYLIFKYSKTVKAAVEAPQGGDVKELERAQQMVADAQNALDDLTRRLAEEKAALAAAASAEAAAKTAEVAAKKTEADAKEAENRARQQEAAATDAENAARAAADEQKAALAELQAQEAAKENTLKGLDAKINDPSGTTVTKGKAKNEYEQLKGTDPLPLQRAKINQGATVRKFERTQRVAEDERKKATDLREQAQKERERAENDRAKAEFERERAVAERKHAEDSTTAVASAVVEAETKFQEALDFLEAEKKKPNIRHGDIWWLGRELEEKKKYLPKSKGGNW